MGGHPGISSTAGGVSRAEAGLSGPEVWLRDMGGRASDGEWDECWVPCARGDPGALLFTLGLDANDRGVLAGVERAIRRHLESLQFKSTGRDPKTNGYAYAEVPDWALRQWLSRIEIAQRGQPICTAFAAKDGTTDPLSRSGKTQTPTPSLGTQEEQDR